jgi:hypothetical protein
MIFFVFIISATVPHAFVLQGTLHQHNLKRKAPDAASDAAERRGRTFSGV